MSEGSRHASGRRAIRWTAALVVAIALGAVGGYALADHELNETPGAASLALVQSDQAPPRAPAAAMIRRVLPSVVNVRVTKIAASAFGGAQEAKAEGSGVVLTADGLIATNNHVVEGAVQVTVVFTDGRPSMRGTVIGTDPQHDVAVIHVDASGLEPITLGRSAGLEIGDAAYALGFPLGLGPTVTRGIVSGLNRAVEVQGTQGVEHLVGLLQTDAAINPGNSGGALVDASGQLVGINTAAAEAGTAENVGFAISIDEALPVIRQIATQPPARQAWLGVETVSVDSAAASAAFGLPPDIRGAAIVGTVPGGPAAKAGLRPGEVIVSIDGVTVRSAAQLTGEVATLHPGQGVEVTVATREGTRRVEMVRLTSRPPGL